MEVFRTGPYLKSVARLVRLGASQDDVAEMEKTIALDPLVGLVIPGSGGLRKARFRFGSRGKRGGGRVIYYALVGEGAAYLLVAYAKADEVDLTSTEVARLKALVEDLTR